MVLGINNIPSVMPEDLENLIQQGYQLIDVRENDEWDAGHYKVPRIFLWEVLLKILTS